MDQNTYYHNYMVLCSGQTQGQNCFIVFKVYRYLEVRICTGILTSLTGLLVISLTLLTFQYGTYDRL